MFHFFLFSIFILRKSILWLFRTTHPLRKDILITWSKGKLTYSGPYVIQRWPPTKHVTYLKVMRYLDGTKQSQHSEKLPIVILYTWKFFEDAHSMSEVQCAVTFHGRSLELFSCFWVCTLIARKSALKWHNYWMIWSPIIVLSKQFIGDQNIR